MQFEMFSKKKEKKFYQNSFLTSSTSVLFISLFTWLPLLILTLFSSTKFNDFLTDYDVHVRFLVSLPLLLFSEIVANDRLQILVNQFINCRILRDEDQTKFKKLVTQAAKRCNSIWIDLILFIFVFTAGPWIASQIMPDISAWYVIKTPDSLQLTLPGYWYAYISLPLFQYILLRWYYRILIWIFFLWKVSRLDLQLNSLHPDRAAGLGFLVNNVYAFESFLMAHSFLLSGIILNFILNSGASLWDFQSEILIWLVLLIFIPILPLLFFLIDLAKAKRDGTNEFAVTATRYVSGFRNKWIDNEPKHHRELLGSSDIQSLADLSNSFNVSTQMRILPVDRSSIFFLVFFTALPFLPLLLTVVPLDKILSQFTNIIF